MTKDGRVKILDFGLAKLTQADGGGRAADEPADGSPAPSPASCSGTVGYMSPEQVRGQARRRALRHLLVRRDPLRDALGPARVPRRLGGRHDVGDPAGGPAGPLGDEQERPAGPRPDRPALPREESRGALPLGARPRVRPRGAVGNDRIARRSPAIPDAARADVALLRARPAPRSLAAAVALASTSSATAKGASRASDLPPAHLPQGAIWGARFGSDGKTILTTAAWDGKPSEIYVSRPDSPESRPFGLPGADLPPYPPRGEVAVLLKADFDTAFARTGTLARVPRDRGRAARAARERRVRRLVAGRQGPRDRADPERQGPARVSRRARSCTRRAAGSATPGSRRTARGSRSWTIARSTTTADPSPSSTSPGRRRRSLRVFASSNGLAWSPDGSEVWFTAAEVGSNRVLRSATLSGRTRTLARVAGSLTLEDVTRDGRVLISHDTATDRGPRARRRRREGSRPVLARLEPHVGHLRRRAIRSLQRSGRGRRQRATRSTCARLDGSPAVRLGEGNAQSISADGKWVLAFVGAPDAPELVVYPTGAGEAKKVPAGGLAVRVRAVAARRAAFLAVGVEKGTCGADLRLRRRRRRSAAADRRKATGGFWSRRTESVSRHEDRRARHSSSRSTAESRRRFRESRRRSAIAGWTPDGRLLVRKGSSTEIADAARSRSTPRPDARSSGASSFRPTRPASTA